MVLPRLGKQAHLSYIQFNPLPLRILLPGTVRRKYARVVENAAADHDAVQAMFLSERTALLPAHNVTIADDQRLARQPVAELTHPGNGRPVSGAGTHLSGGTSVDGQQRQILLEQQFVPRIINGAQAK